LFDELNAKGNGRNLLSSELKETRFHLQRVKKYNIYYVRDGGKGLASRLEDISQAFHLDVKPSAQCAVTTKSMSHFGFHKSLFVEGMRGMNVCTMAMIMGSRQFHIGLFPVILLQSSQSGHLEIHISESSWFMLG
jgi:hypothetical protein